MHEYVAGDVQFRLPSEAQPPMGSKIIILTVGGVAVIGHWGVGCVAWSPLPEIPEHIKAVLNGERRADASR